MNVLLDTLVPLWFLIGDTRLSNASRGILADPDHRLYLSAISAAEIGVKFALGKLRLPQPPAKMIPDMMAELRLFPLPLELHHGWHLADLPRHHNDPFDRLLIAQAIVEDMPMLTADAIFRKYPVKVIW